MEVGVEVGKLLSRSTRRRKVSQRCKTCKQWTLPGGFLSNVSSLRNKTDELQANVKCLHEYRGAAILTSTGMAQTWQ